MERQAHNVKDLVWKLLAKNHPKQFVRYFYKNHLHLFDFSEEFIVLDTELVLLPGDRKIVREAKRVDLLIKVPLIAGSYLLILVEIQGKNKDDYPKHVHDNFCRLFAQYHNPISVLVIYTETTRNFRSGVLNYNEPRTLIEFKFNPFVVSDQKEAELEQNPCLIGLVVLACLLFKKCIKRGGDEQLLKTKIRLIKALVKADLPYQEEAQVLSTILLYKNFEEEATMLKFESILKTLNLKQTTMSLLELYGYQSGIEGEKRGEEKKARLFVEYLLKGENHSLEQISSLADVTMDFILDVRKGMTA